MNLCSDGHDEICFEGRHCPACSLIQEIEKLEKEVDCLKESCDDLQRYIDNYPQ